MTGVSDVNQIVSKHSWSDRHSTATNTTNKITPHKEKTGDHLHPTAAKTVQILLLNFKKLKKMFEFAF